MKKFRIEVKWGILFFLSGLAWMALEKYLGWHDRLIEQHATYTLLYAPLAIFIYVVALWEKKRKTYSGRMTFLQGLLSGMVITLVVVLLTPLSQYISHSLISPDYFSNIIQLTVNSGKMTLPEAEAYFNLMNYIVCIFCSGNGNNDYRCRDDFHEINPTKRSLRIIGTPQFLFVYL